MTEKELMELGLTEELAKKVIGKYENMIPKSRLDEETQAKKELESQLKDRDKQLEDLSKNNADNEVLKKQILDLQAANNAKEKEYQENLAKIKLDNALEIALTNAGSKNNKAVKALLNMENIKLDNDKLFGFDEQLAELKKSNDFLFEVKEQKVTTPAGTTPGASNGGNQGSPISLSGALAGIYNKN